MGCQKWTIYHYFKWDGKLCTEAISDQTFFKFQFGVDKYSNDFAIMQSTSMFRGRFSKALSLQGFSVRYYN